MSGTILLLDYSTPADEKSSQNALLLEKYLKRNLLNLSSPLKRLWHNAYCSMGSLTDGKKKSLIIGFYSSFQYNQIEVSMRSFHW